MQYAILTTIASIGLLAANALAQSNIDPVNKHAWNENAGYSNWRDADSTNAGVIVGGTALSGFAWFENVGWMNLDDGTPPNGISYANVDGSDFGVNIDYDGVTYDGTSDGTLHGLAWLENAGWANFDGGAMATPPQPARIDCDGRLFGFVWCEHLGWMNLSDMPPGKFVSVDVATVPLDCDMNHDGLSNGLDIQLFVEFVLSANTPNWRDVCSGDLEGTPDGMIDFDDVADFVACLLA